MSTTPTQQPPPNGAVGFIRPPRRQRRHTEPMKWNPENERKRQVRDAHNRFEAAHKDWRTMSPERKAEVAEPRLEDFLPVEGQLNVTTVEEAAARRAEDDDFHAPPADPSLVTDPGANSPPPPQATPAAPSDPTPPVPKPPANKLAQKRAAAAAKGDRDTVDEDDVMPEPPQIDIP